MNSLPPQKWYTLENDLAIQYLGQTTHRQWYGPEVPRILATGKEFRKTLWQCVGIFIWLAIAGTVCHNSRCCVSVDHLVGSVAKPAFLANLGSMLATDAVGGMVARRVPCMAPTHTNSGDLLLPVRRVCRDGCDAGPVFPLRFYASTRYFNMRLPGESSETTAVADADADACVEQMWKWGAARSLAA